MNTLIEESLGSSVTPRDFVSRSPGVSIAVLRRHADGGITFLVRMREGARAERHDHPGGEETYLLTGKLRVDRRIAAQGEPLPDAVLCAGDYLYASPGEVHEGIAESDETTFLVVAAGGVVVASAA